MTDVVKGTVQAETVVYEWKIERFIADCGNIGDSYTSPFFCVNDHDQMTKWYIRIYPKGLKENKKEYISLWLNFDVSDDRELTVDFVYTIMNQQNILCATSKFTSTFKGPSVGHGVHLDQSIIKDIGVLTDDTITIICWITYQRKDPVVAENFYGQYITKILKVLDDFEEILEDISFSDVTFNIRGQKIHAHKAILSCRSPVFKAMFENDMKENKQNSVDITNFDYSVMKELFRFIYAVKVKDIDKIAKDLFFAADYYSIGELKALCENILYEKLEVNNAVEYLQLTDMCDTIHLKTLVTDFAAKHYKEIIKEPGFEDLSGEIMHRILQAVAEKDDRTLPSRL